MRILPRVAVLVASSLFAFTFVIEKSDAGDLAGLPLRYLIGAPGNVPGEDGTLTVVGYDADRLPGKGIGAKYVNLFNEKWEEQTRAQRAALGPYLYTSDTAANYREGQIDPRGPGWNKNLTAQFERARRQGFDLIEIDNMDAYEPWDVIDAVARAAQTLGLGVLAKNPLLMEDGGSGVLAMGNVSGVIVERGAGDPERMNALRVKVGRPTLPVWFVAFGPGRAWADKIAPAARRLGMRATYSSRGEYGSSVDVVRSR